jgi:phosphonopyruvate decarboxylase
MIDADQLLDPLRAAGFTFFTGVPCSFLTPLINRVVSDPGSTYLGAASEGEAVAIAAGAWLAGRQSVVMCQNSGLGNAVNPLTSLNAPFRIPSLLIVTWRGQPGLDDEPQHQLMGEVTEALLDTIRIPHAAFPDDGAAVKPTLDRAVASMAERELPYALIVRRGSLRDEPLRQDAPPAPPPGEFHDERENGALPKRVVVLERLLRVLPPEAAVVATTGKTGRELFTLGDRDQLLYQVGSMGCASGMALGVALNVARSVVVVDGDGAALMKLGTMATIGAAGPRNLVHLLLDNGVHDSTGGQATASRTVDFARVALACGYRHAASCDSLFGFIHAFGAALSTAGPTLIHVRIAPGSMSDLGRPTVAPREVARRFRRFLAGS